MELNINVNAKAGLRLDSGHFGEMIRGVGEMKTIKILIVSMTIIITALIFNLDKVESLLNAF